MEEHLLSVLVLVGVLGIGAQWLAWRMRIPAILVLIVVGLAAGPWLGWIEPSDDLGPILQPVIAICVAIILFEGGLNLRWHEFRETGVAVNRLVTLGVAFSWALGALAAHYLGNLSWPVALVFGAIIVVTGPTVIMPLLRQAKLKRRPAALLKWEGIINDPVGALFAVLVYEYFVYTHSGALFPQVLAGLATAVGAALVLGVGGGFLLGWAFRKGYVPEYLKSPVLVGSVLAVYLLANHVQEEGGLLAVTVLGVVTANRPLRNIDELRRFKEYMTVMLVSVVFVLLTADMQLSTLQRLDWHSAALLAAILLVVRPLAIYLATIGAGMDWRERVLLGWIAPRGIVAAAVAGLFAPRLMDAGYGGAELLLPLVFALILVTVVAHGLSIGWLARKLGLAADNPSGVLIVGASPWVIQLAEALQRLAVPVLVSDSSWHRLQAARMHGLETHYGEILSAHAEEHLEINNISHVLAATANDAYNALVCTHFAPELGRNQVYQLAWQTEKHDDNQKLAPTVRGRLAFGKEVSYETFMRRHYQGWRFHATELTASFGFDDFRRESDDAAVPICVVRANGNLAFFPLIDVPQLAPGDRVVSYGPQESGGVVTAEAPQATPADRLPD